MFGGLWQLTKRSLREESSRLGPHAVRLLMAGVLLGVIIAGHLDTLSSATGLPIFKAQLLLTHLFLMINAVFGFSQVIVEERESGTLDLLKLAGINPLSIIVGKSLPRFWESTLLIAVQFPFTLLTMTLGGVSWSQVAAGYVTLFACLVLVAGLGLFASTICESNRSAVAVALILLMIYLLPFVVSWLSWRGFSPIWLGTVSLQQRATEILRAGFDESPWCPAVTIAAAAGTVFFVGTWWYFDSGLLISFDSLLNRNLIVFKRKRRRAWSTPLIWKDYFFLTGGIRRLIVRSSIQVGLVIWMVTDRANLTPGFAWAALLGCPIGMIDGSWTASRLFADEIRNQTWSVLVQTPLSMRRIVIHKTIGWTLGTLPSIVCPFLFIFLAIIYYEHADFENTAELVIGTTVTGLAVFAYLHLMVLLSLDWYWKAIPATLIATCVMAYIYMWLLVPWRSDTWVRCILFVFTGFLLLGVIGICQVRVMTRLKTLAGAS